MPYAPSTFRIHPAFEEDLKSIQQHNPDHAERILRKVKDWEDKLQWGRVPQDHLTYLSGSGSYNFYREYVGKSGYRVIYEISNDTMTVIAALPKGDNTYDLGEFQRRMGRL
ncbi:type II toxin-antitoxin system RelE/ParE family toxin [Natrinema pallidum]|uniref:type II toxin-antitoxin system RelE family toxin n=1 Tax=Natrinema pallidum TaxID=69527 RepID=UPI0037536547